MKDRIQYLIKDLYDEADQKKILKGIEALWKKYHHISDLDIERLDEKDVALITYGDQVYESTRPKLEVLQALVSAELRNIISIVHLLPIYPYSSDDGFSVKDYHQVRQDLGDWADVQSISESVRVMLDAVINHMSSESRWFQSYLRKDPQYEEYFIDGSNFHDLENVVRPRTSPLLHDFGSGSKIWTTFSRDQVDLNFRSPEVLLSILEVLLFYISNGGTILRLDAIGFLWKSSGTSCIHLPATHALIKVMRCVIDYLQPSVLLISETNVPHVENVSYFGEGDEAHLVYNFTLPPLLAFSILYGTSEKIAHWMKNLALDHQNTCFFNFLASHDGIGLRPVGGILEEDEISILIESAETNGGLISYRSTTEGSKSPYEINCNYFSLLHGVEGVKDLAIRRMILAHAILLTFPGLPAIYFHSLFGSENDLEGVEKLKYNRAINREKLSHQQLRTEVRKQGSVRNRIFEALIQIINVKKKEAAFDPYASFNVLEYKEEGLFGYSRGKRDALVYCIFNLTKKEKHIPMPPSDYVNLFSGERNMLDAMVLPPYGFLLYRLV